MTTTEDLWVARQEKPQQTYSRPYDPDPARHLHLSQAGGCPRKEALRLLGYAAEPTPPAMQERFNQGHFWEEFIGALWQAEYGAEIHRQVPVETDYGTGYIDLLWDRGGVEGPHQLHLIEVKTTTSDKRNWLPNKDYIDQLMLYGHFYPRLATDTVTLELVYFVMDTHEVLSYSVTLDPVRVATLVAWLKSTQAAVEAGTPPGVPAGNRPNKFPCAWPTAKIPGRCPMYTHCWEGTHVRAG